MIPLDTKQGATVWVFSTLSPESGVYRGTLNYVVAGTSEAYLSVPRSETPDQFPFHQVDVSAVHLTEADATAAYAAWLFKRGEEIAAELHENEKRFWVAKQRLFALKSGAPEREVKS